MFANTLYVALPFHRTKEGHLVAGEAKRCPCAVTAKREAEDMIAHDIDAHYVGAVAFTRMLDASSGRCENAALLSRVGDVPTLTYLL